jgi:hypothetical protein
MARENTRRMHKLRQAFFLEGKKLAEQGDPEADCWLGELCYLGGVPIDYEVPAGATEASHNLDHYQTVSEHPELQDEPTNFRHSHRLCNERRKTSIPTGGLGEPVPAWW